MELNNDRLQNIVNICAENEESIASKLLNIKPSSLERYLREAKIRGLSSDIGDPITPDQPRIIILDVENSPSIIAAWGIYKQFLGTQQIIKEWYMLSWSLKYLHGTEIHSDVLTPEEAINGDDKRIMESLWTFIDYADIIIGHNMDRFDKLKINSRFIQHGMKPPSSFETLDTLKVAKGQFAFTSNKLDYLCKLLGIPRKADNGGMERWLRCMEGSPEDLIAMELYNRHDVTITEDLYIKLRPYCKGHPNLGLYGKSDIDVCYKCGSVDINWLKEVNGESKYYRTTVNRFPTYRCNHCQTIGRSRFSADSKENRFHITSPVAR